MTTTHAEKLADGLAFPEGPRWHGGALWLSDMQGREVVRLGEDGVLESVAQVPECPSGLGFLPDGRLIVVSQHDRRLLRLDEDGLHEHADLSDLAPWHLNDMAVDAHGRAYVGNYGDASVPPDPPAPTVLILVEPDGSARVVADDLLFPNGVAVTPDGGTLIVAETRADPGRLSAFTIDSDGGLRDRRLLATFAPGEMPDGIAADAESGVWVALPFNNELVRVDADGVLDQRIAFDNPYAVALGGPDGRDLFVCSAPTWEPEEAVRLRAGAVHRLRVDVPAAGA